MMDCRLWDWRRTRCEPYPTTGWIESDLGLTLKYHHRGGSDEHTLETTGEISVSAAQDSCGWPGSGRCVAH